MKRNLIGIRKSKPSHPTGIKKNENIESNKNKVQQPPPERKSNRNKERETIKSKRNKVQQAIPLRGNPIGIRKSQPTNPIGIRFSSAPPLRGNPKGNKEFDTIKSNRNQVQQPPRPP